MGSMLPVRKLGDLQICKICSCLHLGTLLWGPKTASAYREAPHPWET